MDGTEQPKFAFTRARRAILAAAAGWAVPGLGHLFLRRWVRACVYFAAVSMLALTGYWLRGNVFSRHPTDAFSLLGFLADVGSGIFYFFSHRLEAHGPDVSIALGDWGTRFLATAGVLNVLCVLDAIGIALHSTGSKNS